MSTHGLTEPSGWCAASPCQGLKYIRSLTIGTDRAELSGRPVPLFLLEKAAGTVGAGQNLRTDKCHWTPVHLDLMVEQIEVTVERAVAAGARIEHAVRTARWGTIAVLAGPFGQGLCLSQFLGRGYGEEAEPEAG